MREAMAPNSADSSLMCKRVTVVIWALAHLTVTLYVLRVLFGGSGSSTTVTECVRELSPSGSPEVLTEQELARREAALEFRRQAAPLLLILRVKDIEAEVAVQAQQVSAEEVDSQETGHQGVPVDDAARPLELPPREKCYPELNTDLGGVAVRWGLTFHVGSAAECCEACSKQAAYAEGRQRKCNVWVFCPERKGCPSPDGYEHRFGECWLKQAEKPPAVVGNYSVVLRGKSASPLPVLWISGVIA